MKKFFLLSAVICFSAHVWAGPITSGGGDDVALEFQSSFKAAISRIKSSKNSLLREVSKINFESKLPNLKVATVTTLLETSIDDLTQESTAMNYLQNQLIKINRERWNSIINPFLKEGLALHEMLSLIGKEGSGNYKYSSQYVSELGVSETDLVQRFQIKRQTKTYIQNKIKFTIFATERFITNQVFETIRIDYMVKRDDKELIAQENSGGTMYACNYGDYLPDEFIDVLGDGNNQFGFIVKGLGVCGNTSSERWHLIVPLQDRQQYAIKQITTKVKPTTRVTSKGLEFWYLQQDWGQCGTAGSFFVPILFLIHSDNRNDAIESKKLPADISLIPEYENYPLEIYMSLFTAGLRTHDGQLMETASRYFKNDPDSISRYKWCGLPDSQAHALELAKAMKKLGTSLDFFH